MNNPSGLSGAGARSSGPRVLITGGAGFLGSHLSERFLQEGWQVIVLDNLLTGSIDNIASFIEHPDFKYINYNVTNYLYFAESIDLILHFACPASPVDYIQYPIQTMKVDSLGTLNSLGLARAKKARYIFASTSEVYGNPDVHPQPEEYWGHVNPVGPRSVYDEAKRFSEAMSMAYFRHYGMDVRIARIFNTYGSKMRLDDGRVIPTFIANALSGKPLTLFGSGTHTRSFCHVSDLVDGIYLLATRDSLAGEVVNLGNPEEITIRQMADMILELTGSDSILQFKPMPADDPVKRKPDISKAARILGFNPRISLRQGLARVIPWFREKLGSPG